MEWARQNRGHPVADRILNANKSKGRKLLDAAMTGIKGAVARNTIKLISAGVSMVVKFLSSLPALAEDVRKISLKGALYNISDDLMKQYRAMANAMSPGDNGEMFQKAQAVIHSKLGDILKGDLSSVIENIAPLSALANGTSTESAVRYYTGLATNPDEFMRSALSDVMKASFQGKMLGKEGDYSVNDAFSANVLYLKDLGLNELALALFRKWQTGLGAKKDGVTTDTVAGGDFVDLIWKAMGKPLSDIDMAGGVQYGHAQEVEQKFSELSSLWTSTKDGILIKILDLLEPLADFLRSVLKSMLNALNKTILPGQFEEVLYELNEQDRIKNEYARESIQGQVNVMQTEIIGVRERYGMSDKNVREAAIKEYNRTGYIEGLTSAEAVEYTNQELYYARLLDRLAALSTKKAESGEVLVSGVTSKSIGSYVTQVQLSAAQKFNERLEFLYENSSIRNGLGYGKSKLIEDRDFYQKVSDYIQNPVRHRLSQSDMERLENEFSTTEPNLINDASKRHINRNIRLGNEMLATLEQLELELDKDISRLGEDMVRDMRLNNAVRARQGGEQVVIQSQVFEDLIRKLGTEFISAMANNTINFRGIIEAEKREYHIVVDLRDQVTGEIIRSVRTSDISNPGVKADMDAGFLNNFNFEAAETNTRRSRMEELNTRIKNNEPGDYSGRTNWH